VLKECAASRREITNERRHNHAIYEGKASMEEARRSMPQVGPSAAVEEVTSMPEYFRYLERQK
jgi:hypothetical protein